MFSFGTAFESTPLVKQNLKCNDDEDSTVLEIIKFQFLKQIEFNYQKRKIN